MMQRINWDSWLREDPPRDRMRLDQRFGEREDEERKFVEDMEALLEQLAIDDRRADMYEEWW